MKDPAYAQEYETLGQGEYLLVVLPGVSLTNTKVHKP